VKAKLVQEQMLQKKPIFAVNTEVAKNWIIQSTLKGFIPIACLK